MAGAASSEQIDDDQILSRHLWERMMLPPEFKDLVWPIVFEFPGGKPESLFWQRFIQLHNIHEIGCDRQKVKRLNKAASTYLGAASTRSGTIREFRTSSGHGFRLAHEPEPGKYGASHVHIYYDPQANSTLTPSDKSELKLGLGVSAR